MPAASPMAIDGWLGIGVPKASPGIDETWSGSAVTEYGAARSDAMVVLLAPVRM